jgi:cell division protein FtsI/penicillin-binding protein 2
MFRKRKLFLIIFLSFSLLGGILFYSQPSKADFLAYQNLMEYSDRGGKSGVENSKVFTTQQTRTQITKQIFFMKEHERLQWRLMSEKSELKLSQVENTIELIEYFTNVACQCQEQFTNCDKGNVLCEPSQFIRYLKAKEAVYHYKTEQLVAEDVYLTRYKIKGHQWVNDLHAFFPLMQGRAKKIQLSFTKDDRSFHAQDLQAIFQEWNELL